MNAQLLTALSADAASAKSGINALSSRFSSRNEAGVDGVLNVSFADLLGQQTGAAALDPELLDKINDLNLNQDPQAKKELLAQLVKFGVDPDQLNKDPQATKELLTQLEKLSVDTDQLNIDPQAKKELLAQLEEFGIDPDQLNKLLQQLNKITEDPKQLIAALRQIESSSPKSQTQAQAQSQAPDNETKSRADFINSTLFVANESKAIRLSKDDTLPTAINDKNRFSTHFDLAASKQTLRFDLNNNDQKSNQIEISKAISSAKAALSNSATLNNTNDVKDTTTPFSVSLKTAAPASSLLNELNGLTAQAGSSAQTANQSTTAAFTPTYSAQITTPIHQTAQWSADFGRVMVQMSQQAGQSASTGLQSAEIRLDPPELGPMRIMLSINEGVANAMIFAAHAQTRQAVELSLPQLQQQLAQSGISLGEANVSDQNFFAQSEQQSEQNKNEGSEIFSLHGTDQGIDSENPLGDKAKQRTDPDAIIDTFA